MINELFDIIGFVYYNELGLKYYLYNNYKIIITFKLNSPFIGMTTKIFIIRKNGITINKHNKKNLEKFLKEEFKSEIRKYKIDKLLNGNI